MIQAAVLHPPHAGRATQQEQRRPCGHSGTWIRQASRVSRGIRSHDIFPNLSYDSPHHWYPMLSAVWIIVLSLTGRALW